MKTVYFLFAIILFVYVPADARTIKVPLDQKKISQAMAKASRGDSVLVSSGTYPENIMLKKGVVLLGGFSSRYTERDPARFQTVITGVGRNPVVMTSGDEDAKTVLDGFTLTNGRGSLNAELGAFAGGGLYITSSPVIRNNRIISNGGDSTWGGGVYFGGGQARFIGNVVERNTGEIGAGILCYGENSAPELRNNIISENGSPLAKTEGAGGGICVLNDAHPTIDDNKISGNGDGCRYGGGIWISGANPVVSNNFIGLNNSAGGYGGGIGCQWSGCMISGNIFEKNSSGMGGGIWCSQSNPEITKNKFIRNSARGFTTSATDEKIAAAGRGGSDIAVGRGGGIACQDYATPRIENNLFEYNAASAGGAVSVTAYSSPIVRGNTMVKNRSNGGQGAGIQFDDLSGPTIDKNIITDGTYGFGLYYDGQNSQASITCNNVWGNAQGNYRMLQAGQGDISEDPMFCDGFDGNYYIGDDSPCVNVSGCGRIGVFPIGCTEAVTDTTRTTFVKQRRFTAAESYNVDVGTVRMAVLDMLRESGEEIDRIDTTVGMVESSSGQTDPGSFLIVTKERNSVPQGTEEYCTNDVPGSGPWRGLSWTINILVRTVPVVTVEIGVVMKTTETIWGGASLRCYSTGKLENRMLENVRKKIK